MTRNNKIVSLVLLTAILAFGNIQIAQAGPAADAVDKGYRYFHQGKYDEAIAEYNRAVQLEPDYYDWYNVRGAAYEAKGDYDKAITDFDKSIQLAPHMANSYYNPAVCHYFKKNYDKAWDDVHKLKEKGRDVNPKFVEALKKASGREN